MRDFDLRKRLFRYPLSYMIYSPAFDALPETVRDSIYRRLHQILSDRDSTGSFAYLTSTDRAAVKAILEQTRTNLPGWWQ